VPPPLDDTGVEQIEASVRQVMGAAWRDEPGIGGFCVPHASTYPWQWLWDSCFHAVVWAHLGDERALAEVASALSPIDDDGFVPHMRYVGSASPHSGFWGRPGTSSITQPPMYGHALAEAARLGMDPPARLLEQAARGVRFLLHRRRRSRSGLVQLCHPWESGCDDSPRWDDFCPGGWDPARWYDRKGTLLVSVERAAGGAPVANPEFAVGSAGFSALVAFNAAELAPLVDDPAMAASARELIEAVDARWDGDLRTWVDDGAAATGSGRVRTHDALMAALVTTRPARPALAELVARDALGGRFGPASVHRAEPTFDPGRYWRGSSWPQLTYLSWLAAVRSEEPSVVHDLRSGLLRGAITSGFAEHWDADSGRGLGAVPQSWTSLAWVVARTPP
jgi:glucosylglycerate hydrolase